LDKEQHQQAAGDVENVPNSVICVTSGDAI